MTRWHCLQLARLVLILRDAFAQMQILQMKRRNYFTSATWVAMLAEFYWVQTVVSVRVDLTFELEKIKPDWSSLVHKLAIQSARCPRSLLKSNHPLLCYRLCWDILVWAMLWPFFPAMSVLSYALHLRGELILVALQLPSAKVVHSSDTLKLQFWT